VNDDGPPSKQSSPYVHSLVKTLQEAGHTVSVVLPHTQRSWIGKAHIIGQTVKPTYFRPGTLHNDDGTTHSRPLPPGSKEQEEWVLVDGTPASCVQIGLYHYFQDRGPIDLVVSGPNYGRNSTAVFSLSSGTLGGALEAAVCQRRAVALSYAFFSRNHDPEIIAGASKLSVRLIEYLYKNWGKDVDLYSVNVPLVEGVENKKILWTAMLQNYWGPGSCFQEIEDEDGNADEEEQKIREGEGQPVKNGTNGESGRHKHKHFKWAPRFTDVYKSVEEAGPGNDGWAVKEGFTRYVSYHVDEESQLC
jgi:tubulin--tyrosine ligase